MEKPVTMTLSSGIGPDGVSSISRVLLVWYERFTREIIDQTVTEAIKEGVRKHLLEDDKFRAKVSEAIEKAASAMPLDAISEAVRKAVFDMRTEGEGDKN